MTDRPYRQSDSTMDDPAAPRVSVIILNWNHSARTIKCVETVRRNTRAVSYEIIVVDNGSAADDLEALKAGVGDVRLVSLSENMFFGEGNNIAAEVARGTHLLLLNNDVLVGAETVDRLVADFDVCFSAGAIGPKFLYPDGTLQEAGAFLRPDGWAIQQGKDGLSVAPRFDQGCHIVDYCSAACLLIKREVFLSLAGFDPLFDPAYFEDADICLRLRSLGLYVYYTADATVFHEENATSAEVWNPSQMKDIVFGNHRKFMDRWGNYLANRLENDIPVPYFPTVPELAALASEDAGRERMLLRIENNIRLSEDTYEMLRYAAEAAKKFRVVIATPEICSRMRIRSICQKINIRLDNFEQKRLSDENEANYRKVVCFPLADSREHAAGPGLTSVT